jgi:hypothetical protein
VRIRAGAMAAVLITSFVSAGPAMAGRPTIVHESAKKEVTTLYFPDDICGPRAGWTTFVETWRFHATDLGDSLHINAGETGWYTTDFDDPSIEDYRAQYTEAVAFNLTRGGTATFTSQFHDFPGDIRIHEQIVFHEVDGEVLVEREVFRVTGCP